MRLTKGNLARISIPPGKAETIVFDDDLPGFGLRLRAGGKRTWLAQYRVGTKQRRLTLGTVETVDPDEARKRAKAALARVSLGEDPAFAKAEKVKAQSVTIRSTLQNFLTHAQARQRPSTYDGTRRYMDVHWAPLLDMPLASVDRPRVAARLLEIARENGPVAGNRSRAALSSYFTWAIGEGLANANPTAGTNKPGAEVARDRVLSADELRLAWQCAGDGDFGAIVRLLILTAARRDEIAALSWSEISGSTLAIPGARTKSKTPLLLDLPPLAVSILAGVEQREGRDLLFGRSGPFSGFGKAREAHARRMLDALRAERGPKAVLPPFRLHDLRRTAATGMADLGVQPHVVEAVLNHISGSKAGVAGIYNRAAYRDEKRAALALWAGRVERLCGFSGTCGEPNK
ncbi:DUF4102 domain-containing protein [Lichenibacterium minor]|uniref:DUF4102 domain-containing protein n=1 Tax=Lichenibacterium minor TaxID=2316528 RepID=A0A4Q2U4C3_9HYPH|nr:integrase arm-type DNA-binding domain-containing protein [Lichenibacterium minor]RYC31399.1 DUF4102 domain-containing protein [Lichenibacterium minor]